MKAKRAGGMVQVRSPELKPQYYQEKKKKKARYWWLTPVILATWESEIRRILVRGQPRQIV
jgi:hypothetical protein